MIFPTVPVKAIAPLLGLLLSAPTAPALMVEQVIQQVAPTPKTERVQPLADLIPRGEGDWNEYGPSLAHACHVGGRTLRPDW